ncbi:hypothetical protein DL96DRAFT_1826344 [Flagelloscypha sp. PMI_526]|nr:hypothetical protein DL96DRAFT_1826344 [Flagelloscypha sp. PMI_526]
MPPKRKKFSSDDEMSGSDTSSLPASAKSTRSRAKKHKADSDESLKKARPKCGSKRAPKDKAEQQVKKGGRRACAASDDEDAGDDKKDSLADWKTNHALTDQLLTLIEDDPAYRQAFGFDTSGSGTVNSHGKTVIGQCRSLAIRLFNLTVDQQKDSTAMAKYGDCIKNRVAALKRGWNKNKAKLKETGHGLVMEEKDMSDTALENVWQKIILVFPWYRRMTLLMGKSPSMNTELVVNSSTSLDLTLLSTTSKTSPDDSLSPDPTPLSPSFSDPIDVDGELDDVEMDSEPKPAKVETTDTKRTGSTKAPPKKKTIHDMITETQKRSADTRLQATKLSLAAKQRRADSKEQGKMDRERHRIEAKLADARERRQHELEMKRMDLEMLKLRHGAGSGLASTSFGGDSSFRQPQDHFPTLTDVDDLSSSQIKLNSIFDPLH